MLKYNEYFRETNLTSLPTSFVELFSGVAHFSLDLRDNKMQALESTVFYNNTMLEDKGTRILEGMHYCLYVYLHTLHVGTALPRLCDYIVMSLVSQSHG